MNSLPFAARGMFNFRWIINTFNRSHDHIFLQGFRHINHSSLAPQWPSLEPMKNVVYVQDDTPF